MSENTTREVFDTACSCRSWNRRGVVAPEWLVSVHRNEVKSACIATGSREYMVDKESSGLVSLGSHQPVAFLLGGWVGKWWSATEARSLRVPQARVVIARLVLLAFQSSV